jgi:hypothetical protein
LVAGLAGKAGLPKQAIAILIQVPLLWGMHRYYALNSLAMRLSTYIQVMLEPVLPGLRWEGRNGLFEERYNKIRYFDARTCRFPNAILNWSLHRFAQVFCLLTAIGIYVSFDAWRQIPTRDLQFYVLTVVLAVLNLMSAVLVYKCVFRRHTAECFVGIWQGIKQREQ